MGWKIEYRALNGKMLPISISYSTKIKADIALRRKLHEIYGRIWLTLIEDGTKFLSSTHSIVMGTLIEHSEAEVNVDAEFRRRMREYHETNCSKTRSQ